MKLTINQQINNKLNLEDEWENRLKIEENERKKYKVNIKGIVYPFFLKIPCPFCLLERMDNLNSRTRKNK